MKMYGMAPPSFHTPLLGCVNSGSDGIEGKFILVGCTQTMAAVSSNALALSQTGCSRSGDTPDNVSTRPRNRAEDK